MAQPNFTDFTGKRAMGFYDDTDLPFYYFMASNFRHVRSLVFSCSHPPALPNRFYWMAATSQGFVVPPNAADYGENDF